jgi:hypothetical protein
MRMFHLIALAFVSALFVSPAGAATVQCGTATDYVSITTDIAAVCGGSGTGGNLNGINDPVNALGYTTLDITPTGGIIPLTISTGGTSGSFSFGPTTGYEHFVLGFQTSNDQPNPDWFYFFLADTITSGTWSVVDAVGGPAGLAVLERAILYGQVAEVVVAPVPLPAALVLFGTALAGFFGFSRLRERFSRPAVA